MRTCVLFNLVLKFLERHDEVLLNFVTHLLLGSFSRQYTLLHFSYYVAVQAKSAYGYGNWTKDVYVNVPDKNTTVDNNYSWLISYFVMTTL